MAENFFFLFSISFILGARILRGVSEFARKLNKCLVLGAQAQTRTAIIGRFGTELDAQKQFKKLLEDSIRERPDIPTSIARYQKAISDTHVRLDYVIAAGLYIIGSDMVLKVGTIENYNNNILIEPENMKQGRNNINDEINKAPPLMEGPRIKTYKTRSTGNISNENTAGSVSTGNVSTGNVSTGNVTDDTTHEDLKFILAIVAGGVVSLIWYFN